jgi:DNA polymerase I-like protein with 3'-5' exonuclease and polymerase domains
MYGCGPGTLASNLGVSQSVGQALYDRIYTRFPTAVAWLHRKQEEAKNGVVTDYFGRPRKFVPGESHKARNFFVQSTAATVCQEKLINLWKALDGSTAKLIFSVHDGYSMLCRLEKAKETYQTVKEVLEAESSLCPVFKLSAEIKFVGNLSDMKLLWK